MNSFKCKIFQIITIIMIFLCVSNFYKVNGGDTDLRSNFTTKLCIEEYKSKKINSVILHSNISEDEDIIYNLLNNSISGNELHYSLNYIESENKVILNSTYGIFDHWIIEYADGTMDILDTDAGNDITYNINTRKRTGTPTYVQRYYESERYNGMYIKIIIILCIIIIIMLIIIIKNKIKKGEKSDV